MKLFLLLFSTLLFISPSSKKEFDCKSLIGKKPNRSWWDDPSKGCAARFTKYKREEVPAERKKAVEKAIKSLEKRMGAAKEDFKLVSVRILERGEPCQDTRFVLRYEWKLYENYKYRFAVGFNDKGKASSEISFPKMKEKPVFKDPCPIHSLNSRLEAMDDNKLEYIELGYHKETEQMVWQFWGPRYKPFDMNRASKNKRVPKDYHLYEHKVNLFDATTGEHLALVKMENKIAKDRNIRID